MALNYRRLLIHSLVTLMPTRMLRSATRSRLTCLVYHTVSEDELPHITNLYNYNTPEEFELHLDFLQEHFNFVSCADIRASIQGRKPLPCSPALITFDDGLVECYTVIRPILLERKVPCVFFVTRDFIDNQQMFYAHAISLSINAFREELEKSGNDITPLCDKISKLAQKPIDSRTSFQTWVRSLGHADRRLVEQVAGVLGIDITRFLKEKSPYLSSEQVGALANDGFEIGAHGTTHRNLGKLEQTEAADEIVASCNWIRSLLNLSAVSFAFPYGGENIEPLLLKELMKENNIDLFFFSDDLLKIAEPFALGRVWGEYSLDSRREPIGPVLKREILRRLLRRK